MQIGTELSRALVEPENSKMVIIHEWQKQCHVGSNLSEGSSRRVKSHVRALNSISE